MQQSPFFRSSTETVWNNCFS